MDETLLHGGIGNFGLVTRLGDTVRRPWRPSTPATHALLRHLNEVLPGVAPVPLGRDEQGREVLSWLDGDVAISPYPPWVAGERFLVSLGQLLRRIHDALEQWPVPAGLAWSDQIPDPCGGPLIVHADVCLENVIVRDGLAVAIIDWEFAAPGRRLWDVISTARLCVPFTAPARRARFYPELDAAGVEDPALDPESYPELDAAVTDRLRVLVDAYGLAAADRVAFTEVLEQRRIAGERFVRDRVARGETAFADVWGTAEGERLLRLEEDWVRAVPADIVAPLPGPGLPDPGHRDYLLP